jgi:hypothetical protein
MAYTINQIKDGVLVTGPLPLRAEGGAWTVLVTIEKPPVDPALPEAIQDLMNKLKYYDWEGILLKDRRAWLVRLERAELLLTEVIQQRVQRPTNMDLLTKD